MRILRYTLFLFAIGLISCEQEFDKKEQQSDCCSFQNLPKYPEQVVNINVHNSFAYPYKSFRNHF